VKEGSGLVAGCKLKSQLLYYSYDNEIGTVKLVAGKTSEASISSLTALR
jgi:hypothetical protein